MADLLFSDSPFRIKHEYYGPSLFSIPPQQLSSTTKVPLSAFYATDYPYSTPGTSPGIQAPILIAPNPVELREINPLKRIREDEEYSKNGLKKRKRVASISGPHNLNEEQ